MDKIVRVLNITTVLQAAGIESFIMNMYRHVDRKQVQFDFMVMRNEKEFYDDEIAALGGKKYTISIKSKNTLLRIIREAYSLYIFLRENPYEIVHIHYTTPLRAFYLFAAKKAGVAVRIYHSHSAEVLGKNIVKRIIYRWCRKKIYLWGTQYWACSRAAAKWMFEENALRRCEVINNGIDTNIFRYNADDRERIRHELGLGSKYTIINTGRFLEQKNQSFIIYLFKEILKKEQNCTLLFLGTGPLEQTIKDMAISLGLQDSVHFLGVRTDVYAVLSAADCYIMPSLYEGLPVAAIEAQSVGLPCVLSTNITKEVKINDNVHFLSLDDTVETWVNAVLSAKNSFFYKGNENVKKHGYDIQNGAKELQNRYIELSRKSDIK